MRTSKILRWERRPAERPRELLEAALTVFAEKGYHNTRLEEVGEAAGVTKGTIYHYFNTKEKLLLSAVEYYHEQAFGQLDEALSGRKGPVSVRVRLFFRKAFGHGDPRRRKVLVLLLQGVAHEVPKVYRQWLATGPVMGWKLLEGLIDEGKASGEFRSDADSEVAARVSMSGLMLQLVWQQHAGTVPGIEIDEDRLIDSAVELLLQGLRTSSLPV
jgi:AcrR family transcriptional regulator